MRPPARWQRLKDVILSTDPRRRTLVGMALLALTLMVGSAGVMLLVAHSSTSVDQTAVQWWAALSVGGLAVMTAFIRSGETARLRALSREDFGTELNIRSAGVLRHLTQATQLTEWPIISQIADRFTGPRTALIAEAAA